MKLREHPGLPKRTLTQGSEIFNRTVGSSLQIRLPTYLVQKSLKNQMLTEMFLQISKTLQLQPIWVLVSNAIIVLHLLRVVQVDKCTSGLLHSLTLQVSHSLKVQLLHTLTQQGTHFLEKFRE